MKTRSLLLNSNLFYDIQRLDLKKLMKVKSTVWLFIFWYGGPEFLKKKKILKMETAFQSEFWRWDIIFLVQSQVKKRKKKNKSLTVICREHIICLIYYSGLELVMLSGQIKLHSTKLRRRGKIDWFSMVYQQVI